MNNLVGIICDNCPSYVNINKTINMKYNAYVVNMTCICHSINFVRRNLVKTNI